MNNEGLENL